MHAACARLTSRENMASSIAIEHGSTLNTYKFFLYYVGVLEQAILTAVISEVLYLFFLITYTKEEGKTGHPEHAST